MNRFIGLALLSLAALALAGCSSSNEVSSVVAAAPNVAASPSSPSPEDSAFVASGPVVVENQVDVAALREGVVVTILAEPGTHVHKGQLLANLDDRQISADLDAASAKVRSIEANLRNWQAETKVLQADLARAQKMWDAQLITKEVFEHTQYKVEADEYEIKRESELLTNAKAAQRSLELEKEKTRISAPFDGIVARRYVRLGQKVAVGDRLFWVTAEAPLEVKFTLPERLLGKLKKGDRVTVALADATPAVQHTAKVVEISPVVDPSSGTIEVLTRVEGPAPDLRPGMLTTIHINHPR